MVFRPFIRPTSHGSETKYPPGRGIECGKNAYIHKISHAIKSVSTTPVLDLCQQVEGAKGSHCLINALAVGEKVRPGRYDKASEIYILATLCDDHLPLTKAVSMLPVC